MRIRRNAKISAVEISTKPPLSSGSSNLDCKLNQSPWDSILFHPHSESSPYIQVDGDDSFTGNGNLGDSIGAMDSFDSMKLSLDDEDNSSNIYGEEERENEVIYCSKTFGEGNWECCREAKQGSSFCEFHLVQLKSSMVSDPSTSNVSKKPDKLGKNGPTRRAKKAKKSESNPYEIYYYSGFGPHWAKKRGAENADQPEKLVTEPPGQIEASMSAAPSSSISSNFDNENFDYFDEYDDDDEEEDDGIGKKRPRKPIKARSLKSLM